MPGKFIVLYGINNLGKSTQAAMLIDQLKKNGVMAEYLKYPIYDLEPTGPQINEVLRGGNPQHISEIELQQLYAQNRHDYQPTVEKTLAEGTWILAEDYIGTGLAWGVTKGAPLEILEKQNEGLLKEDLAILLDGERFMDGKEHTHLHESDDDLMNRCRLTHQQLAQKYGWHIVSATGSAEEVNKRLWEEIKLLLI